jgi:hypothetical protein
VDAKGAKSAKESLLRLKLELEQKINARVYELYGITKADQDVINNFLNRRSAASLESVEAAAKQLERKTVKKKSARRA